MDTMRYAYEYEQKLCKNRQAFYETLRWLPIRVQRDGEG